MGTGRPLRGTASAVISATAPASVRRAATAFAAKPEKIGTTMAPILAHGVERGHHLGRHRQVHAHRVALLDPGSSSALASRLTSADSSA